jgi:hypothetical protein
VDPGKRASLMRKVMDDRRFDALVRSLAAGRSRRQVLRGMLGLGGAAVASAAALPDHAHAARRGFSGPAFPTPCVPNCDGTTCGSDGCGGTCTCGRDLLCIVGTGLCGQLCPCGSDCHCDPFNNVCASNQVGPSCGGSTHCPTGTYCEDIGNGSGACVAPCTSVA